MNKAFSIIIPAYNEEDGIVGVIKAIQELKLNGEYEVIVVDDGSTDKTYDQVSKLEGIKVIRHPYNKGYGSALKTGIRKAQYDICLIMDSDGQHDPKYIPELIREMEDNEMVVGARSKDSQFSLSRKPGKWLLSVLANFLSDIKIPDLNSGLRAIKKDRIKEFMHILPNGFSFSTTITLALLKAGYNVKYIPVMTRKRVGRKSTVSAARDGFNTVLLIIRTILLFNPLKVFVPVSLAMFIAGFLFSLYGVIAYHRFPGTGITVILTSVIIFFVGILADQISLLRRQ
jgi:glycosyltransferase involved in cell wall biosynthesis